MALKKIIIRIFLISETILFSYLYFFGPHGITMLQDQHYVIHNLLGEITDGNHEIDDLKQQIYTWQTDEFFKEKVAREQLQMARKGDKLFYIGI